MMLAQYIAPLLMSALNCAGVRMTEDTIALPTYGAQVPDKNPLFFRPEEVQLAERHIYPYPFYDVGVADKEDGIYKAVILENEYLKICVTPEMGGRLYYALDKSNGYDIVYNNRVVKPALIGTLGAWTSGGVEWNTPHHHRATSLLDVDYTCVDNDDGSKTVWVGEYEKRNRTRWLTGLTLEPGKAYIKIEIRSMNVTPYAHPALYFANVAVHVNDAYQFVFPPDVNMINFHYVTEFARWPVPNQVYQSVDYTRGEDLSWWNATKEPVSFFVTDTRRDFMGGIDHDKNAGIAMIGDHRIFKGKKVWNWGKNEVQEVWDRKLTDEDGPYAELMMGFYSDNQPDYNYVAPFETKYGDMYLYGVEALSGIKEANRDCAINLELHDGKALVQVNATSERPGTKICLHAGDAIVFEEAVDVGPGAPYTNTVSVDGAVALEDLTLAVYSKEGVELASWHQQRPSNEAFPEPCKDPADPAEYTSGQELFFAGLKLEQFGNTNFDYMKYYEAALQHNPNDVLTNTQLGQVYLRRGEYALAELHLKQAVDIVTGNHKKALEAASLYYLGVCYMHQGKIVPALDMLYRATWAYAWTSAGYTLIAPLEATQQRWDKALEAADRACKANTLNVEALTAKAVILRKQGCYTQALRAVEAALALDPLCFLAMNERLLLCAVTDTDGASEQCRASLENHLRKEPYNYLETAARYSAFGLFDEAAAVVRRAAESEHKALNAYPMVYYHLGMYLASAGRDSEAAEMLEKASQCPVELCFPYGEESRKALRFAVSQNPDDGTAWYLLGNTLADYQHEAAIDCWRKALQKKGGCAIIYRNIAYIQANHLQNMPAALDTIMTAISLDPADPRYFAEASLYLSYAALAPDRLTKFLDQYGALGKDVVDIQLMQVKLDLYNRHFDHAIHLLSDMRYHIKEGATFNPHVYWFDAHLGKGLELMRDGAHEAAEQCFLKAMEFPSNLEAERNSKTGIALYYLGLNRKRTGDMEQAANYFRQMTSYTPTQGWGAGDFPEIDYFKALAALELGQDREQVDALFQQLIADAEKRLATVKDGRHITVSVDESHSARTFFLEREISRKTLCVSSYYARGLGFLGLGDTDRAETYLDKALEVDPLCLDAHRMLESMHQPKETDL